MQQPIKLATNQDSLLMKHGHGF